MLFKTKAIVLKSVKYGDSGLVTQFYTEEFGRQSVLVHGVRKRNSKLPFYLFEPLSLLDIDIYYKENRDLQKLKHAQTSIILNQIKSDIKKTSIALFISEILYRCLKEIESNKTLFTYLFHAIQVLEMAHEGIENYHLIFLIQLSKFLGIFPKNNTEQFEFYKNPFWNDIFEFSLQDLKSINLDQNQRQEFLNQLVNYYRNHMEGMGEIKSLQVLHEVFL